MKKILFYTDTPLLGGAENQMLLLAKFLPKESYEVTLACSSYRNLNAWCQQFMENGAQVIRLQVFHKHDPRHFLYLKKILPHYDLLHLHLWNPASARYALLAASKIPVVITEHDPFPMGKFKTAMRNKLVSRAKRIIIASEGASKIVERQAGSFGPPLSVIPNGIDVEEWKKAAVVESRADFRRKHFSASPQEKVILCVAELNSRKGQKYLIDAFKLLAEEMPNLKLVFVGDGPARKQYEKRAAKYLLNERILFLGHQKEVAKLMSAADVFVLPSVREAFGLVLLEAAAAGVPVIATRVGGIPEIIEDFKTGLLVPSENAEALVEALRKLFQNPKGASIMRQAALDRVEILFNAKTMAEKTAEVYGELLMTE